MNCAQAATIFIANWLRFCGFTPLLAQLLAQLAALLGAQLAFTTRARLGNWRGYALGLQRPAQRNAPGLAVWLRSVPSGRFGIVRTTLGERSA